MVSPQDVASFGADFSPFVSEAVSSQLLGLDILITAELSSHGGD